MSNALTLPAESLTDVCSWYEPSATPAEFHLIVADHASGSSADRWAWAVPMAVVPSGPMRLHVTVPEPSPVRIDADSTRLPLTDPLAGSMSSTTGVLVAGAQVKLMDWVCWTCGAAGSTGRMPYV